MLPDEKNSCSNSKTITILIKIAAALIEGANKAGGLDNITVILAQAQGHPSTWNSISSRVKEIFSTLDSKNKEGTISMAKIYIKFNAAILKEVELDKNVITFGRKPGMTSLKKIQPSQAFTEKSQKKAEEFFIEDLNSTNGTFFKMDNALKVPAKKSWSDQRARHIIEFVTDVTAPTTGEQFDRNFQCLWDKGKPGALYSKTTWTAACGNFNAHPALAKSPATRPSRAWTIPIKLNPR